MLSPKRILCSALAAVLCIICATVSWAQADYSSLTGTVTDASGAVLPNAHITVHNDATGAETNATSNANGSYTIPNLPSGSYTVTVTGQGFTKGQYKGVVLDPSIPRRLDVSMKVGDQGATIDVQAGANAIQTETATVGQLVTQEQVKSIQLNGRNPLYLSQMEPGVNRGNSMGAFSFGLDNGININGARSQESLITFDGAPMVRTRSNGTSVGVADVDSTGQVQILTTSYPAEYGRSSGGMTRIVPKSGTSQFHGSAYEYFRNTVLNANLWSRNHNGQPRQAFRYNQFGWNFNGPFTIPKVFNTGRNKLFFLLGQEWIKYNHDDTAGSSSTSSGSLKVPTLRMRQGDFGELLGPNIFYGAPIQLINPITQQPCLNNDFSGGKCGIALSPNGIGLLNAYPVPNLTGNSSGNWSDTALYTERQRKDTIVIDYVPGDRHKLRFSLLNYNYNDYEPHYGNFNRNPRIFKRPNQVAAFRYTWTISPTLVNEAYVTAAADHVKINIDTSSGLYDRTRYGINYPYLYSAATKTIPNKIPTISLANFGTLDGGPYPSSSGGVVYDYGDNITKVVGSHTLKFGALWEYAGENNFDQISVSSTTPGATNNQNGFFTFTDQRNGAPTTNAAVANAALGLFDTYGEIGQRSYTVFRGNMIEMFGQDQWHATSKLNLEFGVRYSIMTPYYAQWGNQSFFNPSYYVAANAPTVNPTTGFISGGDPYTGVVIPGTGFPSSAKGHVSDDILNNGYSRLFHGLPRGYHPTVWSNIQPRLGFAYQIDANTVFRGGVGRYFQRLGISDVVHVGGNAPFQPSSTVSAGSVDTPGGVGTNAYPTSLTSQQYIYPSPEAYAWNLTLEHDFTGFATFTLGYVGRRGVHLELLANRNQLLPGTTQANPGVKVDALRPFKGFSTILEAENRGTSNYHSLQANLRRRLSKGILFGVAYTWSKSLDYASANGTNIPNYYNLYTNYGPSDFDTRHVAVINYVWDLPGGHLNNWAARSVLGNWQFSGLIQFQSGRPFSVATGNDIAGVGPGSGNQYYIRTKFYTSPHQFSSSSNPNQYWFDKTAYVAPAPSTFAPRGSRNTVYGPGFSSFNAALQKSMHIIPGHENHTLVFKAEAFNYLNHPNWDNPDVNPTSGTFGKVTGKGNTYASDRQFQFSLRYAF